VDWHESAIETSAAIRAGLARPESRPRPPDKGEKRETHVAEGDARAIDFVVEMVRYDEGNTLTARLERGELKGGDVAIAGRALGRSSN
jgi:hypothetical protein